MADFYDIHCHLMNLSHPNYILFIKRLKLEKLLFLFYMPIVGNVLSAMFGSKLGKIINLLSIMDNDICEALKLIERKDVLPFLNGGFKIGDTFFDSLTITPLMIDFGRKYEGKLFDNIWYDTTPHKAIKEQVIDLFYGISEYLKDNKKKVLKIYPFLGLNTKNYSFDDELDDEGRVKSVGIKSLLDKYFEKLSANEGENRERMLNEHTGNFRSIEELGSYSFAGIKLYPPLDFDPWPDDGKEREKVKYLYEYCEKKAIPITVHCGIGGFQIIDDNTCRKFASPDRWERVLEIYPKLKINFAHFASSVKQWRKKIINLMKEYPGVYTDIAYVCFNERDYICFEKEIKQLCESEAALEIFYSRLMFGSDYIINLLESQSYFEYLNNFKESKCLKELKVLMANVNPKKFLFGV